MRSSAGLRRDGDPAEMAERYVHTPETKEFFRTSEFLLWALAALCVLIASAMNEEFDSPSAWTVITVVTTGYIVSWGLAKAGTPRGWDDQYWAAGSHDDLAEGRLGARRVDPRSDRTMDLGRGDGSDRADEVADRFMEEVRTPETKEFFRTSEFLMWLLGVAGVLVASAFEDAFGTGPAWTLIAILSGGYILSRGLAKAGTARGWDIDASRRYGRLSEASTPETKESFRTSELGVLVLTILGLLLAAGADSGFDAGSAWRLIAGVATAYMISRGFAKIGTPQDTGGRRSAIV